MADTCVYCKCTPDGRENFGRYFRQVHTPYENTQHKISSVFVDIKSNVFGRELMRIRIDNDWYYAEINYCPYCGRDLKNAVRVPVTVERGVKADV